MTGISSSFAFASGPYLTVTLASDAYGIAVGTVREVIPLQPVVRAPDLPEHFLGVIHRRGKIIPVADLRTRFGLTATTGERTRIVVVQTAAPGLAPRLYGLVVDGVGEVTEVAPDQIEPPPEMGAGFDPLCLLGIARIDEQVKLLLDIDGVVAPAGAGDPFDSAGRKAGEI